MPVRYKEERPKSSNPISNHHRPSPKDILGYKDPREKELASQLPLFPTEYPLEGEFVDPFKGGKKKDGVRSSATVVQPIKYLRRKVFYEC